MIITCSVSSQLDKHSAYRSSNLLAIFYRPNTKLATMRFGAIIVAGLAAVASAIPATEVVVNINIITTKSRDLQMPAKDLSISDARLFLIGRGNIPVRLCP